MTEIIKTDKCKIIYRVEIYNIIQGNTYKCKYFHTGYESLWKENAKEGMQ